MKCPECGTTLHKHTDQFSYKWLGDWVCNEHHLMSNTEWEKRMIYQQRLSAVLEKFIKENGVYYYDKLTMIDIDYKKDRGFTISPAGIACSGNIIFLATVEHLIKDMEAQDE